MGYYIFGKGDFCKAVSALTLLSLFPLNSLSYCLCLVSIIITLFTPSHLLKPRHYTCLLQDTALQQHVSTTYGLNEGSVLHQSLYFHVSEGLTPDIMHDVLQSCLQFELKEMFKVFISKNVISLSDLNHAIQSFPYGMSDKK